MKNDNTKRSLAKTIAFIATFQLLVLLLIFLLVEIGMLAARFYIRSKYQVVIQSKCPVELGGPDAVLGPNLHIYAIGDSHTWGVGASPEMNYPEQLIRLICGKRPDIRPDLMTIARPGWNTAQALEGLRTCLNLDPTDPANGGWDVQMDLIVICVGKNNDHNLRGVEYFNSVIDDIPDRVALARLLEKSGSYQLSKITRSRIKQVLTQDLKAIVETTCVLCDEDEPFMIDWLRHDYRKMIAIARAKKARIVFMNYYEIVSAVDKAMMAMAESEKDVIFVNNHHFNLPPPHYTKPFQAPDTHPNEKGYARIAHNLYQSLEKRGWLNPRPEPGMAQIPGE